MAERIVVGRIRSPYGIQGWVWMDSFTEQPDTVFEWTPWMLTRAEEPVSGRVAIAGIETLPAQWQWRDKAFVVRLEGLSDRTQVEALVNCLVEVDAKHLPALDDDRVYWRDLMGCRVGSVDGLDLGFVHHVMPTGANDVLVIRGDAQSVDRRERLVPYIRQTVLAVDLERRQLVVDWDPEF